mgnify:CR=1 FL=1
MKVCRQMSRVTDTKARPDTEFIARSNVDDANLVDHAFFVVKNSPGFVWSYSVRLSHGVGLRRCAK